MISTAPQFGQRLKAINDTLDEISDLWVEINKVDAHVRAMNKGGAFAEKVKTLAEEETAALKEQVKQRETRIAILARELDSALEPYGLVTTIIDIDDDDKKYVLEER